MVFSPAIQLWSQVTVGSSTRRLPIGESLALAFVTTHPPVMSRQDQSRRRQWLRPTGGSNRRQQHPQRQTKQRRGRPAAFAVWPQSLLLMPASDFSAPSGARLNQTGMGRQRPRHWRQLSNSVMSVKIRPRRTPERKRPFRMVGHSRVIRRRNLTAFNPHAQDRIDVRPSAAAADPVAPRTPAAGTPPRNWPDAHQASRRGQNTATTNHPRPAEVANHTQARRGWLWFAGRRARRHGRSREQQA